MSEHNRRQDDISEPQTSEELTRVTYRMVKEIKVIVCGESGKDGLCDRVTKQETIVMVLAWVVGLGAPSLLAWLIFFRHGG